MANIEDINTIDLQNKPLNNLPKGHVIVILGPTAVGKTQLAVALAKATNGEIISADSRQVYRHMNIGTGKDLEEYIVNNELIPYHLIDIMEPGQKYNVSQFQNDFQKALNSIFEKGKTAILCGGTGMYIQAVLQNFEFAAVPINELLRNNLEEKTDQELAIIFENYEKNYTPFAKTESRKRLIRAIEINEVLKDNPLPQVPRLNFNFTVFGIQVNPNIRKQRITDRLKMRVNNGLIEEVRFLNKKMDISYEMLEYYGLEYKFVGQFLQNQIDQATLFEKLNTAICQFAKRQMTYFRKMEKDGITIHWLDGTQKLDFNTNILLAHLKQIK